MTTRESSPLKPHHLDPAQVSAIHTELRSAAGVDDPDLDVVARTGLYAGLATVALLDHLRGGRVSTPVLRTLAPHSETARHALDAAREQVA